VDREEILFWLDIALGGFESICLHFGGFGEGRWPLSSAAVLFWRRVRVVLSWSWQHYRVLTRVSHTHGFQCL